MIPNVKDCQEPLLHFLSDGKTHSWQECSDAIANHFHLTQEERNTLQPNGKDTKIHFNVGWAKHHLRMAGMVETVKRGHYRITEKGMMHISKQYKSNESRITRFVNKIKQYNLP